MKTLFVCILPFVFLFIIYENDKVDQEIKNGVIEITATHDTETGKHLFNLSTKETNSGWTTLRFTNASPHAHFAILWKLPDNEAKYNDPLTFDYWKSNVTVPFQESMDNIINPNVEGDATFAPFSKLPDWFEDVEAFGGPGLTSSGRTSETTVKLKSGKYIIECYVKDEDEVFHSSMGMVDMITVLETSNDIPEPKSDWELSLSSTEGIKMDNNVMAPGKHTFVVNYKDQKVYEHMVGHDIHLVQMDREDIESVAQWMNWMVPGALVSPAPSTFLGGSEMMKSGDNAYFTIQLEPGDYAWIAKVPAKNKMWHTFSVSSE